MNDMSESFAELFESSLSMANMQPGSILQAKVIDINNEFVKLDQSKKYLLSCEK